MTFTLTINCDNAAFERRGGLRALLREVSEDLWRLPPIGTLKRVRDVNGNTVGTWTFERDEGD